jgi:hypothetical protein
MNQSENKEKYILLDNLFNLYLDSKYDKEDEDLLKKEKIDIDAIVQENIMLFRQLRTKAKAEMNEAKHIRVKKFLAKIKAGIASGIEEYQKIADEIFSKSKFAELQPMFRNLKEVSEQDKKAMLMDSKLLDMLGEIEEEYNKESNDE